MPAATLLAEAGCASRRHEPSWECDVETEPLLRHDVSYMFSSADQLSQTLSAAATVVEGRGGASFSEQIRRLTLKPQGSASIDLTAAESAVVASGAVSCDGIFHVLTRGPTALHSFPTAVAAEHLPPDDLLTTTLLPLDSLFGTLPVGISSGVTNSEVLLHAVDAGALYRMQHVSVSADAAPFNTTAVSLVELPATFHGGKVSRVPWQGAMVHRLRTSKAKASLVAGSGSASGTILCFRSGEPSFVVLQLADWAAAKTQLGTAAAGTAGRIEGGGVGHTVQLPHALAEKGASVVSGRLLGPCGKRGEGTLLEITIAFRSQDYVAGNKGSPANRPPYKQGSGQWQERSFLCAVAWAHGQTPSTRAWLFELDEEDQLLQDSRGVALLAANVSLPDGEQAESAALVCHRPSENTLLAVRLEARTPCNVPLWPSVKYAPEEEVLALM